MTAPLSGRRRLRSLLLFARAHTLEFVREPGAVFWAIGFPILLSWALGFAFLAPKTARTTLVVAPADSAAIRAMLPDTGAIALRALDSADALRAIRRGEATGSAALAGGRLRLELDTASQEGTLARLLVERALGRTDSGVTIAAPRATGGRYADFLFPGMLALGLMNGCIWGIGWALMDLRLRKLLRLFAATPLPRSDILLSVVLARTVILPFENLLLWGFGTLVFGVAILGSLPAFLAAAVCTTVAFAGLGILGASRVQTNQAAYGIINALTIPMTIACGIFFAWTRFPEWIHPLIAMLPLTLSADALRAVSTEGAGFAQIWKQLAGLLAWGLGCGLLGLRVFRWR